MLFTERPQEHPISAENLINVDPSGITEIAAEQLVALLKSHYATPLPPADRVFPWIHAVAEPSEPSAHYFKSQCSCRHGAGICACLLPPNHLRRLMLVIVSESQPSNDSLVGSVTPEDILTFDRSLPRTDGQNLTPFFKTWRPSPTINLRNLAIQPALFALVSDILVYSFDSKCKVAVDRAAQSIRAAQSVTKASVPHLPSYTVLTYHGSPADLHSAQLHDFISCTKYSLNRTAFLGSEPEESLIYKERRELEALSRAKNLGTVDPQTGHVWIGSTLDLVSSRRCSSGWATLVSCCNREGKIPEIRSMDRYIREANGLLLRNGPERVSRLSLGFYSGNLQISDLTTDMVAVIVNMCKLIYLRARLVHPGNFGVLIYSSDLFRATSLLSVLYVAYSTGVDAATAMLDLHRKFGREYVCHKTDVLLAHIMVPLLLHYSPAVPGSAFHDHLGAIPVQQIAEKFSEITPKFDISETHLPLPAAFDVGPLSIYPEPYSWLNSYGGAFPSRILPHLYLGSLNHANSPELLRQLGIKRVLSVGEEIDWFDEVSKRRKKKSPHCRTWSDPQKGITKLMHVDYLRDDGIDSLLPCLPAAQEFLDEASELQEPTLVHCRVGVSRSAALCIAEVMRRKLMPLPDAYAYVRARRLNVLIQPNLRLLYDLIKYEETLSPPGKLRNLDWPVLCREIARLNTSTGV